MPNIGPQDFLISAAAASGAGDPMDCRNAINAAYHMYWAVGNSAVVVLQASPNGLTAWSVIATLTATTTPASGIYSAFYPFVRGGFVTGWAGSTAFQHWTPALSQRY